MRTGKHRVNKDTECQINQTAKTEALCQVLSLEMKLRICPLASQGRLDKATTPLAHPRSLSVPPPAPPVSPPPLLLLLQRALRITKKSAWVQSKFLKPVVILAL